jgi:hypothetical protein
MKTVRLMTGLSLCLMAATTVAQEPVWDAAAIKECDRACLVGILDSYMNAIFTRDKTAVPALTRDVRMTERGGQIHHVEAAPFVTLPYGLGNGWTPGSGR